MITCNAILRKIDDTIVLLANMQDIERALQCAKDNKGTAPYIGMACSIQPASRWYDGYSLDKMAALMRNGDADLLTDVLAELDLAISDDAPRHEVCRAQMGFYPCVPAHIARQPDSMYQLRRAVSPQRKALTLFYNVGFSGGTASSIVREYGHEVMKIVNQLHAERVDVNLYGYVYCSTGQRAKHVLTVVEIQRSEDVYTPERIAATLPSAFCRRGVFGLWEHVGYTDKPHAGTIKRMVGTGYGTHSSELQIAELKAAMPDLDTDSIILMPSVSVHVNPAQLWEPINMKLGRST